MTRFILTTAAALALAGAVLAVPDAPGIAPAPRPSKPKFVAPKFNDSYDVLIFVNLRPVRVRVTVLLEGRPVGEAWRDRLRKAFAFCDRDGDGALDAKETSYVFSAQGMTQLLQNGLYQPATANVPTLAVLDRDADGRVSFEELVGYYAPITPQVIRTLPVQQDSAQDAAVTEALFALLDADRDGRLTRDEVRAAEKLVATHDGDEDECLSMQEVAPNMFARNPGRRLALPINPTPNGPSPVGSQPVAIFPSGRIPGTVTQQLIKKYDRDADFELSRAEVGFDELTFAALDTDASGTLDGEELDVWRTGPPDLDLTLSLAPKPADCFAKVSDEKAAAARGLTIRPAEGGRLVLHVGRQSVDFWAFAGAGPQVALKQQFAYLFAQAAGGKKYIEEKDLTGPNAVQFQLVRVILEAADRDADGKLTRDEFDAYFDLQDSFRSISLSLAPGVQTPTLFQLLDESRDGRLSVRELRTAWDRLIVLEEPGAVVITKNIIRQSITLRLSRAGEQFYVGSQGVQVAFNNANRVTVPTKGPVWFRKMDRNGDGDVSRAEYIGTRAEFDALDADHDDLISLEEAEAFDKKTRAPGEKK